MNGLVHYLSRISLVQGVVAAVIVLALVVLVAVLKGRSDRKKEQQRFELERAQERVSRDMENERLRNGLQFEVPYVATAPMIDVSFMDSHGYMKTMKANDFISRRLPKDEEPKTWVVRIFDPMSEDKIFVVSEYGWQLCGNGQTVPFHIGEICHRTRWLKDHAGKCIPVLANPYPSTEGMSSEPASILKAMHRENETRGILLLITGYSDVSEYAADLRNRKLAEICRDRSVMPKSPRLGEVAEILDIPEEVLLKEIAETGTLNFTERILAVKK